MNWGKRLGLPAGVCLAGMGLALGLAAVAAQGGASPDLAAPDAEAPPANSPPTVGVRGGAVRAGETLVLAAYASDMESEAVHLEVSLDLKPGQRAPAWLGGTVWTADLAAQPILRIPLSPPADAEPGAYSLLVGATDSGGLTSWRRMTLEVLPPAEPEPSAGASPGAGGGAVAAGAPNGGGAPKPARSKASPTASASDSPSLDLSVSPASMAEGNSGDIVVSATLLGAAMVPGMDVVGELQVSGTATDGTDYTLSGTRSVMIPADSATLTGTRTLKLSALGDELRREGDETVMLRVTQVTRGTEVMPLSGAAEASVMVANVFEKPPKVSGVSAEAAQCGDSSCALRVSWEAPAASPPLTEQFVQHRREDKPNGWARMDVPASATEALVTGAQPGRRHLVRVRVRNKAGRSEWSEAAMANTAPLVTASAENGGVASLGEGGGRTLVRLAGSATARGGGTLSGRWFRVYPKPNHQQDEIVLPAGPRFAMESGREYDGRHAPSSDSPEARFYRLVVTHDLSGDSTVGSSGDLPLVWLPQVLLRASPSSVPEDGRTRTVRVEAELTGQSVSSLPKEVVVEVKGGTATLGTDFTADSDFTISIPGGARSAFGTFSLRPRADSVAEGGETVRLQGRASEGPHSLEVLPTEVTIEDDLVMLTVSPVPENGKVTGPGIDCGAGSSGKCSEKVTKSSTPSLTASPSSGYVFDKWSGACSSEQEASCEIVVSGETTVGASFRPPKLTVLVLPAAGGSVSGTGIDCGSGTSEDCVESVSGGSIALTASPASGHAVRFWSGGGCSGTGRTCTAVVTADETVTVAFVEQPAPAAPSGLAAAPGNGQVTLSWTDPGNATITGYEVRHKAGAGAYGAWAGISGSGAGTTSHIVTGLANGTAHSFQLRAENSTGAGASATVSATPDAVPGTVTEVAAAATGADAASLTWTAPTTGGTVASYEVSGSGTIAVSGTSATVTGLLQDTDYSWTVRAANGSGRSAATASNTIRIPQAPGSVGDVAAAATGADAASLTWTAPTAGGEVDSYTVSGEGTITVSGTSATITGLAKDTDYAWTVAAVNVSGTSSTATSNTISIPHAPGRVTGLSATAASGSSATLSWTAPAVTATTGAAASYTVAGEGTITVSGTAATITGLAKDTDYSWTVAAANVSGTGPTEASDAIRIPQVPGQITNLSAAAASGSSATLTWTAPAVTATEGAAASYSVSGEGTIAVSGATATITGLAKDTDYSWTVAAVNVSGTGPAEASDTVRIPQVPGQVTNLSAAVASGSSATLTWTAPAVTAAEGAVASYTVSGEGTIAVSGATATVTGLAKDTDYSWTVAAVNVSGTGPTETSDTISIPQVPGPVGGVTASATSAYSASLQWTAPTTGGTPASYRVSGGGTIVVTGTKATITGLSASTSYSWTVAAVNVSGASAGVASNTVSTHAPPPPTPTRPGPVRELRATSVTYNGAVLSWTAPNTGGTASRYTATGGGNVSLNGTTATITGLSRNTQYTFTVKAHNSGGSSVGRSVTVRTPDFPLPRDVKAKANGSQAAGLTWTAPTGSTLTSYTVSGSGTITVSETAATITELCPGTSYSWSVAAVYKEGTSAAVTSNTVTTAASKPSNVIATATGRDATTTGRQTASLSWTAPAAPDGCPSISYTVSGSGTITVSGTTATITGLSAGTDYSWTVTAEHPNQSSAAVTSNTITTEAPLPRDVKAKANGSQAAGLTWKSPEGGNPNSYTVSGSGTITVSGTAATITELCPGTSYSWSVEAVYDDDTSTAAASNTITTDAPSPSNVSATATGSKTASLSWTAPVPAGCSVSFTVSGSGTITVNHSARTAIVTGLSAGTNYSWTVTAVYPNQSSSAVASNTATTDAPPPREVKAEADGSQAADLTWKMPNGGNPDSYTVSGSGTITVSGTAATITGLSAGTKYTWKVKANYADVPSVEVESNEITTLARTTITVAVDPAPGGSVSAKDISCGAGVTNSDCSQTEDEGTTISPTFTHSASQYYRFKEWNCSPSTTPCPPTSYPSQNTKVTAKFDYTLSVHPGGGTSKTYNATYSPPSYSEIIGSLPSFYHVTVTATASGGKAPYSYQWERNYGLFDPPPAGASAYYLFYVSGTYSKTVEATDANPNGQSASATATINANRSGGASGQSSASWTVPVGEVLTFIWGGSGTATVTSADTAIATATASGDVIAITGVSAGTTGVKVATDEGEFWLLVQVGSG